MAAVQPRSVLRSSPHDNTLSDARAQRLINTDWAAIARSPSTRPPSWACLGLEKILGNIFPIECLCRGGVFGVGFLGFGGFI